MYCHPKKTQYPEASTSRISNLRSRKRRNFGDHSISKNSVRARFSQLKGPSVSKVGPEKDSTDHPLKWAQRRAPDREPHVPKEFFVTSQLWYWRKGCKILLPNLADSWINELARFVHIFIGLAQKLRFSPQALKTFIFVNALVPISHECEKYLLYSRFDTWPGGVSTLPGQSLSG